MNVTSGCLAALSMFFIFGSSGCAQGKRPFLMVQFCLTDGRGFSELSSFLQAVADKNDMTFTDSSQDATKSVQSVGARSMSPFVYMSVRRNDGSGMSATNIEGLLNQAVIGFSEGSHPTAARRFADEVVDGLKQRWSVSTVPAGEGAYPLETCQAVSG